MSLLILASGGLTTGFPRRAEEHTSGATEGHLALATQSCERGVETQ